MHNIHPIFVLNREHKETLLKQFSLVIWMVGLSGSGKSTIAGTLEQSLQKDGYLTQILDGDNLRTGINKNLGFTDKERLENIRRAAEVSKLFMNCGVITICCFISPTQDLRAMAKKIIGKKDFYEIYVNCPLEVCEKRDVKGLYKKARSNGIENFTGISAPFEPPNKPFIELRTDIEDLEVCKKKLLNAIMPLIKFDYK